MSDRMSEVAARLHHRGDRTGQGHATDKLAQVRAVRDQIRRRVEE